MVAGFWRFISRCSCLRQPFYRYIYICQYERNRLIGQKYKYTARPTALRLKYHATLGTVNYNKHNGPLEKDKDIMDQCSFTVCIVDWDTRHDVQSGTSAPKGIWDPITMGELPVDKQNGIIGYGVKYSSENTPGTDLIPLEIPIKYYQQTNAAPDGENKFTIIISVSTSRYGDYLNGCDKNKFTSTTSSGYTNPLKTTTLQISGRPDDRPEIR